MKWIIIIFGVGIIFGVVFPDYRFWANIIIIPFLTPLFLAILSTYLGITKRISFAITSICGLLSVYLSRAIGIVVYGYSVGWSYVTEDKESQAVISATIGIQTITYLIVLGISFYVAKCYKKHRPSDATKLRR